MYYRKLSWAIFILGNKKAGQKSDKAVCVCSQASQRVCFYEDSLYIIDHLTWPPATPPLSGSSQTEYRRSFDWQFGGLNIYIVNHSSFQSPSIFMRGNECEAHYVNIWCLLPLTLASDPQSPEILSPEDAKGRISACKTHNLRLFLTNPELQVYQDSIPENWTPTSTQVCYYGLLYGFANKAIGYVS